MVLGLANVMVLQSGNGLIVLHLIFMVMRTQQQHVGVQPWMTADEIQEAIQTAIANNVGPDGRPATIQNIYLRHIREVRRVQSSKAHPLAQGVHRLESLRHFPCLFCSIGACSVPRFCTSWRVPA